MSAEQRKGNSTITGPKMCKNGCGLYGNVVLDNMCFRCFKASLEPRVEGPDSASVEVMIDDIDGNTIAHIGFDRSGPSSARSKLKLSIPLRSAGDDGINVSPAVSLVSNCSGRMTPVSNVSSPIGSPMLRRPLSRLGSMNQSADPMSPAPFLDLRRFALSSGRQTPEVEPRGLTDTINDRLTPDPVPLRTVITNGDRSVLVVRSPIPCDDGSAKAMMGSSTGEYIHLNPPTTEQIRLGNSPSTEAGGTHFELHNNSPDTISSEPILLQEQLCSDNTPMIYDYHNVPDPASIPDDYLSYLNARRAADPHWILSNPGLYHPYPTNDDINDCNPTQRILDIYEILENRLRYLTDSELTAVSSGISLDSLVVLLADLDMARVLYGPEHDMFFSYSNCVRVEYEPDSVNDTTNVCNVPSDTSATGSDDWKNERAELMADVDRVLVLYGLQYGISASTRNSHDRDREEYNPYAEEAARLYTCQKPKATPDTANDDHKEEKEKKHKKKRCHVCRKKVGLTGFDCRCGGHYCSLHRYSDTHECSFDYKEHGKDKIRKDNPVIVGEKIRKIWSVFTIFERLKCAIFVVCAKINNRTPAFFTVSKSGLERYCEQKFTKKRLTHVVGSLWILVVRVSMKMCKYRYCICHTDIT